MQLSRAGLKQELERTLLLPDVASQLEVRGRTKAGVLVPLFLKDGDAFGVFTKRREDLRRHAGEISFPGGRLDEGEQSLLDTALREAEEEIGLPREAVEIVGALQPTPTISTASRGSPISSSASRLRRGGPADLGRHRAHPVRPVRPDRRPALGPASGDAD